MKLTQKQVTKIINDYQFILGKYPREGMTVREFIYDTDINSLICKIWIVYNSTNIGDYLKEDFLEFIKRHKIDFDLNSYII